MKLPNLFADHLEPPFKVSSSQHWARYLTLRFNCDVRQSIADDGTVNDFRGYWSMPEDRAEHYRREAEKCLDRAELAPDEWMKALMRMLADDWIELAAKAASEEQGVT